MVDQPPQLERAVSVPPSCYPLLSSRETCLCLERSISTPAEGDHSAYTMEMFITAQEMNGTAHELGWFSPETSVGEIKRQASEKMCVPTKAISLASCSSISSGSSLTDDSSPLGEVWPRFGAGANLNVVVQMPASFEETLKRVDDIRVHEDAYDELVNFACQFEHECITPANANLLQRVVQLICDSLHTRNHKLSRGWAITALSKLLEHSMKQLHICHHTTRDGSLQAAVSEKLENAMLMIVEGLQPVSQSDFWLERDESRAAFAKLDSLGLSKLDPELYRRLSKPMSRHERAWEVHDPEFFKMVTFEMVSPSIQSHAFAPSKVIDCLVGSKVEHS